MAAHLGDLRIVFIVIRILSHKNTEKYFSLHAVCIIRVDISGRACDSDRNLCMKVFLSSFSHRPRTLLRINTVLFYNFFVDTAQDFRFVQICDITSRENCRCPFRIRDHGCDQPGSAALHRGNRGICVNKFSYDFIFFLLVHFVPFPLNFTIRCLKWLLQHALPISLISAAVRFPPYKAELSFSFPPLRKATVSLRFLAHQGTARHAPPYIKDQTRSFLLQYLRDGLCAHREDSGCH